MIKNDKNLKNRAKKQINIAIIKQIIYNKYYL